MTDTELNPDAVYPPLPKKTKMGRMFVLAPAPTTAIAKIQEYYGDRFGYDEEGNLNIVEDAFLSDVREMLKSAKVAVSILEAVSMNVFPSCVHEDKFTPDGTSRIFSPQEILAYAAAQIVEADEIIKRVRDNGEKADILPLFKEDLKIALLQSYYVVGAVNAFATMENPPCAHNLKSPEQFSFAQMAANAMDQFRAFETQSSTS